MMMMMTMMKARLASNQQWTDWKQSLITLSALSALRAMYSWVSSWAWWTFLRVDDADNWRGVYSERQGTKHAALRNSVVAADWRRYVITDSDALTAFVEVGVDPLVRCATYSEGVVESAQESQFVESIECYKQVELQQQRPWVIVCSVIDIIQHSQKRGFGWMTAPVCQLILAEVCTAFDMWSHTCHEQSLQHLGYGVQVGDGSVITSNIWVELLFLQQWGDRRSFVTRRKLVFTERELGQVSY